MATPKVSKRKALLESLAESDRKWREDRPVQKTEYYVVEILPDSEDDYGGWVKGRTYKASDYYDTKEECQAFIDAHDPAYGCHFNVRARYLRLIPAHTEWFTY